MRHYEIRRTPESVRVEVVEEREYGTTRRPLRHVPVHSPTGFEYGYGGSGPADLALALVLDVLGLTQVTKDSFTGLHLEPAPAVAWALHQPVKASLVAELDRERAAHDVEEQDVRREVVRAAIVLLAREAAESRQLFDTVIGILIATREERDRDVVDHMRVTDGADDRESE